MRRTVTWLFTVAFAVTAAIADHNAWWLVLAGFGTLILANDYRMEVKHDERARRALLARVKARRALVGQRRARRVDRGQPR